MNSRDQLAAREAERDVVALAVKVAQALDGGWAWLEPAALEDHMVAWRRVKEALTAYRAALKRAGQ